MANAALSSQKTKKSTTHLEKLVSQTKKFTVEELLDLYQVYDTLVVDYVFRHLLFPYTRFSRTWLRDQARDILAGSDRNRLVLTSRFRKSSEADFEEKEKKEIDRWADTIKPRHAEFLKNTFSLLNRYSDLGEIPTSEEVSAIGVSRLVFDDMGAYFNSLMGIYPSLVADWVAAMGDGDHEEAAEIDCYLRSLEAEVGIRREDAWYVSVNVGSIYAQIDKHVNMVTMAYSRLLYRFAHRLNGVTTTEENFSAGYEGMIRAARNYDPLDGSSFTAHCQWWVRSSVLQRQRQSSVIQLPTTTWYQLNLLNKGKITLSSDRVSDLKERAEMFYANSANANKMSSDPDEQDATTFESIHVTSPDALAVLGDSVLHAQAVVDGYETHNNSVVSRNMLDGVINLLCKEDPSLIFPVLVWALNNGIDASLLAGSLSSLMVSDKTIEKEKKKHQTRQNYSKQNY